MAHWPGTSSQIVAGLWIVVSVVTAVLILLVATQVDQQASPPPLKGSPQLPAVKNDLEDAVQ